MCVAIIKKSQCHHHGYVGAIMNVAGTGSKMFVSYYEGYLCANILYMLCGCQACYVSVNPDVNIVWVM